MGNGSDGGKQTMAALVATLAVTTLLTSCGEPKAVPMDDEYAGDSGESSESPTPSSTTGSEGSSASGSGASGKQDTGVYRDGTYDVNGEYGPVGEDTIDVHVTVGDGAVQDVKVVGHPSSSISKSHQEAFAKAIPGVVVGKPLKDLKVDTVAGASWTTEAFNAALEVARQEASVQQ